jgi:hypothetical protein
LPLAENALPAASETDRLEVIDVSSASADRFTVVVVLFAPATTCPLVIVTVTEWLPSLNVSVPLSSAAPAAPHPGAND